MSEGFFKKASKSLAKAKIALTGPAGAGKTLSALKIAKGLGGVKVGVIDTENNSASLYEDKFGDWTYYTVAMNPPYTVQKYMKAIDMATTEGLDVLIIDSLSHVWASEGGLLQQKEALDSRGGNSYTNWGSITKSFEQLKSKILYSPIHIIVTMRSKQEYVMEQNDKGKSAPKKVGLAPIMRDGMEYEFTVVFDIGMDHQFMVSKDRTDLFDGVVATITEDTGVQIKNWLYSPKEVPAAQPEPSIAKPEPPVKSLELVPQSIHPAVKEDPAHYVIALVHEEVPAPFIGKKLSQISEKQLKLLSKDIEKRLSIAPPPANLSALFEINTKIKAFLTSMEA